MLLCSGSWSKSKISFWVRSNGRILSWTRPTSCRTTTASVFSWSKAFLVATACDSKNANFGEAYRLILYTVFIVEARITRSVSRTAFNNFSFQAPKYFTIPTTNTPVTKLIKMAPIQDGPPDSVKNKFVTWAQHPGRTYLRVFALESFRIDVKELPPSEDLLNFPPF